MGESGAICPFGEFSPDLQLFVGSTLETSPSKRGFLRVRQNCHFGCRKGQMVSSGLQDPKTAQRPAKQGKKTVYPIQVFF